MDTMQIKTDFMKKLVASGLERIIKDKLGYDVDLTLYNFDVQVTDDQHTQAKVSLKIETDQLVKIFDGIM